MAILSGSLRPVALGEGYAIRAPGILGNAELRRPRSVTDRSHVRGLDDGTALLDMAFNNTNVTEVRQIDLALQAASASLPTRALRSINGREDLLEVQIPDLGPETGQLILACDETGVLTWHLPVNDEQQVQPPSTRGSGGVKRFMIPARRPRSAAGTAAKNRSLIGVLGKKLLKVLIYPILDPVVGEVSEFFAERWEAQRRPYGLRNFTPANYRNANGPALTIADWQRLAAGRGLLFVHGTFSTAHGAFSQIPDSVFAELYRRYDGRVLAFNHFSLSHSPARNIEWLLANVPPGQYEFDVICHSRGGLVARTLAEHHVTGTAAVRVEVPRLICVGVPNSGTLLAQPDHMVHFLDRVTTLLNLFPSGAVTETLEAILTTVKVIGHGALKGLDGLAAMNPDGEFLKGLNHGPASGDGYYAIAADFEPSDEGLKAMVTGRVVDAVLDAVFEENANDLVVPLRGAFGANGSAAFPIADARVLQLPANAGVTHTTLFTHPDTSAKLLEWLI
jgi:pimeloyl-ACP methyl ester carboxylesterase